MLFNSFPFVLFFAVFYLVYRLLGSPRRHRLQTAFLLAASWFFYGWWDPRFLALLWLSTVLDYGCGRVLAHETDPLRRKATVALSVAINLGILAFFKQSGFFLDSLASALSAVGIAFEPLHLDLVLPVGISFYTFQTLSYTIDVYRRRIPASSSLLEFSAFVAFFPQLVAGPIERAGRLLPQMARARVLDGPRLREGIALLATGAFQKIVVADNLAPVADAAFASPPGTLSTLQLATGLWAFAFQIYGDFAGYSNMARGLACLLGFDLSVNFRQPYFATNPTDFWRRWHVTLSAWLRDYLYIPLGGDRRGAGATRRNLMLVMLLGGLWHGAGWTFLAWGAWHGLLLLAFRPFRSHDPRGDARLWTPRRALAALGFAHLTVLGWIPFRADTLAGTLDYLRGLAGLLGPGLTAAPDAELLRIWAWMATAAGALLALDVAQERADRRAEDGSAPAGLAAAARGPAGLRLAVTAALIAAVLVAGVTEGDAFIYFQF